jgi:nifR3 family TIM-barrel protein
MNFWQSIDKPIIGLSPMDGVTDASFRFITAKHGGADVTLTEFVNVETAFFAPHTLLKDLSYAEIERPVVAQIYGHTPEMFYKVAHIVCELGFDGLDINMGCPAKKVAAKGSGAALIRTPDLARSIIQTVGRGIKDWCEGQPLRALNIDPDLIQNITISNRLRVDSENPPRRRPIPVSVKTRLGYDHVVVEDWMQTLLEEKLAAISLHGRTLAQKYNGDADWGAIGRAVQVAKHSGTLILGNGDLKDMHDVYRRVRETGVDGVLLGRSTQGNPWIFRAKDDVKRALRSPGSVGLHPAPVTLEERFRVLLEHARHFENYGGSSCFVGMRKHLAWYCRTSPRASELRAAMVRLNSFAEVVKCLGNYVASIDSPFEVAHAAAPEAEPRTTSSLSVATDNCV